MVSSEDRVDGQQPTVPLPDFDDAYRTQCVLEAALILAELRCAIDPTEVSDA